MRHLEQQNKILETKLRLLQSSAPTESNIEPMFRTFINMLRSQLNSLQNENEYLTADLKRVHSRVEENQNKWDTLQSMSFTIKQPSQHGIVQGWGFTIIIIIAKFGLRL